MSSFDDLLKKAKSEPRESATVSTALAGELVVLKFTELPGDMWTEITARYPVRGDVPLDLRYGYNVHAVVKAAAPKSGARVEDDKDVPLTEKQWDALWPLLSGAEFGAVVDAVWGLNEWNPARRVDAAKKGLPRD